MIARDTFFPGIALAVLAGGQATMMTYCLRSTGKQYIAAGGHGRMGTTTDDYLIAFALP